VFRDRLPIERLRTVLEAFDGGQVVHTGDDLASADEAALVEAVPALREPVLELTGGDESPAAIASAVEFVLEGLHLSKRLNKDAVGGKATYRGR
jgi:magnesium chelatase subunit I